MSEITFINRDGSRLTVDATNGDTVMEVAINNDIDIEASCEGVLACATCHLILDQKTYDKLGNIEENEEDMLDLASGLTKTSRLSCQIKVSDDIEFGEFSLPDDV